MKLLNDEQLTKACILTGTIGGGNMKKIKDGWHFIKGFDVYVEDGYIMRCKKLDRNGSDVPASVYRWNRKYSSWSKEGLITIENFRSGFRRGTITIL